MQGSRAEGVRAAALKAVSGARVVRLETDCDGATYEAHLEKSDANDVTVKEDANHRVLAVEDATGTARGGPRRSPASSATSS